MSDLRLLPAALAAWLVAGLVVAAPGWVAALVAIACGIGAVAGALLARGLRSVLALAAIALVAGALAATAVAAQSPGRTPAVLAEAARSGRATTLLLDATSRASDGRMTATAAAVTIADETTTVSTPVLVLGRPGDHALERVRIGDRILLDGIVRPADAGESVAYLVLPRGSPVAAGTPPPLLAAMNWVRAALARVVSRLPGDGAELLPGLAIGDTSTVRSDLVADMKASSLTHLTAVSGANCAIVVGLVLGVAGAVGLPRLARLGAAAGALAAFVVLVTPQGSVIRAAVMAAVALVALALGRPARGMPLLCVAVIVLLTVDPWLARDYGFALSALATAGLLLLAGPLARALGRILPSKLAMLVAVPIAAQLACQPVILLLTPALPVYGIAANLLAEPAAPLVTVLGLVATVAAPALPGLASAVAWIAWLPASWIAAVARFFAHLPGAQSPWPPGVVGMVLLVAVTAVALFAVLGRPRARLRRLARAAIVVGVVGYLASVAGVQVATVAGRPADWEFGLCDIGQGDATLIRSGDRIALVDTGPDPAKLRACLGELGIHHIDLLVLTHYDLDHVGGTEAVVGEVDRVLIGPPSDAGDVRLAAELRAGGAAVDQVSVGVQGELGAVGWEVLWPPPTGVEPGNPASVTIAVTPTDGCPRCLSGIFLGDLGEESQDRLLGTMRPGAVDVVKVAHHGSADQSPELYAALRPALGLIGVGAGNDYGHPTAKLLGILASNGVRPLRTDLDGMVLVAPGEREHEAVVWQQKPGGGEATLTGPQVASSAGRSSPRPPRPRVDRAARPGGLLHPGGLRAPPRRPLDSSHALSGAAVPIRADPRPAPIGPPMPGLSRRQFLAAASAAAAAVGVPLDVLGDAAGADAAAAARSAAGASAATPSTLQQTILYGSSGRGGYRTLTTGAGEPYLPRIDVLRRAPGSGRAAARRSLLYLGHLSDLHVIDAQSPARIEPMIVQDHSAWGSAFHPHDPMSVHTTAAMVQAFSDARYSPLTGAPMGAAVVTGDSADMHSHLELRWYIDLLDGKHVDPASAGPAFQGVQAWPEAIWAYRPADPAGGPFAAHGFPVLPSLLRQVVAHPVPSPGIPAPWYAVYGNHDTLLLGTFGLTPQMHDLAVGARKSYTFEATASTVFGSYAATASPLQQWLDSAGIALGRPGFKSVPADSRRFLFEQRDFMAEHFRTEAAPGPVGHGFTRHNLDSGETWWKADLSPQVRAFGLDTCNQVAGPDGAVPDVQFRWLEKELQQAQRDRKLVLILSHHNSVTLENRAQRPGDDAVLHGATEFVEMLLRYPVVVGWLNGHTHLNQILAHTSATGGFWEITTASCIDFPQQQQVVEIVDNRDGTLSLFTTVLDHASPAAPGSAGTRDDLASRAREFAANDWAESPAMRRGSPLDRNTELLLPAPFDLSSISDAALEAQHVVERARILAHEERNA